jgi:hypothetical protein
MTSLSLENGERELLSTLVTFGTFRLHYVPVWYWFVFFSLKFDLFLNYIFFSIFDNFDILMLIFV